VARTLSLQDKIGLFRIKRAIRKSKPLLCFATSVIEDSPPCLLIVKLV